MMAIYWRATDSDRSLAGKLIVASRNLVDPNFFRTVVLILEHTPATPDEPGGGALGVVLNRPTEISIADAVPNWHPLCAEPALVFRGGPVDRTAAIGLARPDAHYDQSQSALTDTGRELGVVNLSAEPAELAGVVRDLRIFSGYAGWSPGQLEAELEVGGWLVLEHERFDPLTSQPASLWNQAISDADRGQGVKLSDGPSVHNN